MCFNNNINIITSIIDDINTQPTIYYSTGPEFGLDSAEILLQVNKEFIKKDIIAYINNKYPTFVYDDIKTEKNFGYIIDAVSQDILLSGNSRSYEIGFSYYIDDDLILTNLEKNIFTDAINQLKSTSNAVRPVSGASMPNPAVRQPVPNMAGKSAVTNMPTTPVMQGGSPMGAANVGLSVCEIT